MIRHWLNPEWRYHKAVSHDTSSASFARRQRERMREAERLRENNKIEAARVVTPLQPRKGSK